MPVSLPRGSVVLVASAACGVRDQLAERARAAGATVLIAETRASAARLLRVFRCDATVCVVGSPSEGFRWLPEVANELGESGCPAPRFVAVDAVGPAHPLAGFDAVVDIDAEDLPSAVLAAIAGPPLASRD